MRKQEAGFTLIELLIVVTIIGILAAVAYPSYRDQVMKSRRTDATKSLMEMAHVLERCYSSYGAYNNTNCSIVDANGDVPATVSRDGYYSIQATGTDVNAASYLTANRFKLRATAQAGESQSSDATCVSLSFGSNGSRDADDGTNDTTEDCWAD